MYMYDCLTYFSNQQGDYFILEARQSASGYSYKSADGAARRLHRRPSRTCLAVSTYWTGSVTWRVELFTKV